MSDTSQGPGWWQASDSDDEFDESATDDTVQDDGPSNPLEASRATCLYAGTGGFTSDGMQVEVSFTNPFGDIPGVELTYALLDGDGGTRFYTGTAGGLDLQDIHFPASNEQFRLTVDTGDDVPANIDETTIDCTILKIEKSLSLSGYERASDADTCEVTGRDSSGRVMVNLSVTSPYDEMTSVQTWWSLQAPGPIRFDSDTKVTKAIAPNETFQITPQFGTDVPNWVGDQEITCTVLGFWQHPS